MAAANWPPGPEKQRPGNEGRMAGMLGLERSCCCCCCCCCSIDASGAGGVAWRVIPDGWDELEAGDEHPDREERVKRQLWIEPGWVMREAPQLGMSAAGAGRRMAAVDRMDGVPGAGGGREGAPRRIDCV